MDSRIFALIRRHLRSHDGPFACSGNKTMAQMRVAHGRRKIVSLSISCGCLAGLHWAPASAEDGFLPTALVRVLIDGSEGVCYNYDAGTNTCNLVNYIKHNTDGSYDLHSVLLMDGMKLLSISTVFFDQDGLCDIMPLKEDYQIFLFETSNRIGAITDGDQLLGRPVMLLDALYKFFHDNIGISSGLRSCSKFMPEIGTDNDIVEYRIQDYVDGTPIERTPLAVLYDTEDHARFFAFGAYPDLRE
jgi:hypothetical protein